MFKKILIANRGEIAVRVLRACRELGIPSLALYEAPDTDSLHTRLADECVLLESPDGFMDTEAILDIARAKGADAIHPGYGFHAEEDEFARRCAQAGITFIGPPPEVLALTRHKVDALDLVRQAGFQTVEHSSACYNLDDCCCGPEERENGLTAEAGRLGYPVLVKSCVGGRGRGERLAKNPEQLASAAQRSSSEAEALYGDPRIYLEKAIPNAWRVGVQIIADRQGNIIHLGERQGLVLHGNQKVIESAPASCLSPDQRQALWETALEIARLFKYENVGTVEFVVDDEGNFYFSELKARIQIEHPLTEMVTRVDLVHEQIRIAAGQPLSLSQSAVHLQGWAMQARINAGDPWKQFIPDSEPVQQFRLPSGPEVRVDTYIYTGCEIPAHYDPLIAKVAVWAPDRGTCLQRLQRSLEEFQILGPQTNLQLLQCIISAPEFQDGRLSGSLFSRSLNGEPLPEERLRDLAVAAAILYARHSQTFHPVMPARLMSAWHRESRQP